MAFCESDRPIPGKEVPRRKLAVILGPTASGKSTLALELATSLGLEILNCDSRQVYREMSIGTALPTESDRRRCPHHLFELVSPQETFSAGRYETVARACLESRWADGRKPLMVGGTGFYFQALTEGMPEIPFIPEIRDRLQNRLALEGREALVEELYRRDPSAKGLVDVLNPRRVTRALEIMEMSGRTLSEVWAQRRPLEAQTQVFLVSQPRELLHQRIAQRVIAMVEEGLETEVRTLVEKYGSAAAGLKSIGYAEWLPYFAGEVSRDQVLESITIHTRQLAKRQQTWFRYQTQGMEVDLSRPDSYARMKEVLSDFWGSP